MKKIIDFTDEEIQRVRSVVYSYQEQLDKLNKLTIENERIRDDIQNVRDKLNDIGKEEEDIMLKLRAKYGDFPIQLLRDYLD